MIAAGMIEAALARGEKVKVWNRTLDKARALRRLGAEVAETPAAAVAGIPEGIPSRPFCDPIGVIRPANVPLGRPERWRKETTMASSTTPVRSPERQPETAEARPVRTEKKPSRFVIKIGGAIPT